MVELRAGAVIAGALRLLRPLGQGGMGIVWAARHLRLDVDVAVKLIHPDRIVASRTLLKRFEREAKAAARITHPNVVRVMDYGAIDGTVPFIVMELLEGAPLSELLARGGRLSFGTAKSLVGQVGDALASAHAQGIVQRDIKPQNIFITAGSHEHPLFVKVLDFGVAKLLGETQVPGGGELTETGVVVGSPPYMSPVQLEARADVDLRTDLWSLGVIVYRVLTGERPFKGDSLITVGAAALAGRYRPASELRPDLPAEIDHWFAKALCTDAAGRFGSAHQMADAFAALAEPADEQLSGGDRVALETATTVDAEAVAPPSPPATATHAPAAERPASAPATTRPRRRRRRVLAASAFVALGSLGALASVFGSGASAGCPAGMVAVAAATFPMGSPNEGDTRTDEMPLHPESVARFCIDQSEVTVRAYRACADCKQPQTVQLEGGTPNARKFHSQFCNGADKPEHPVNCVDWSQAQHYCASQGKRLPSEQEWELAARGTAGRLYPWGNEPPNGKRLNACGAECSRMLTERRAAIEQGAWPAMHDEDDGAEATAAVGRYPAAGGGIWDLAGNVWEWTSSSYCPYGHADCGACRRVLRGGGWDTTAAADVRAARRLAAPPWVRSRSVGFRCVLSP